MKPLKHKHYTETELRKAVAVNYSVAGVLNTLGIIPTGGTHCSVKKNIDRYGIDNSHFTGQRSMLGRTRPNARRRDINDVLVYGKYEPSHSLKQRLIKEGLKEKRCEECKRKTWMRKPIPLELHHVDGDRLNNSLDNLMIICPNCHSFTENFAGKKLRGLIPKKPKGILPELPKVCLDCGRKICRQSIRCKSCSGKHNQSTKIQWPATNELIAMVEKSNYLQVARQLGVSDNAIRKRIKNHAA